ncbi:MAG: DASS family sodium-coupled anion symporter [Proteobacteria bacterium]|nr:DASS family sodium-coupled anion symporter [Pseudomonadota bacterium]
MAAKAKKKATGYDKYVDWKLFIIPVMAFIVLLAIPAPYSMKDVAVEYDVSPKVVKNAITKELFKTGLADAEQWQVMTADIMEKRMNMGAMKRSGFLKVDQKWCRKNGVNADAKNLDRALAFMKDQMTDEGYRALMERSAKLKSKDLKYEDLDKKNRALADKGAWQIKVAIAVTAFVVICFFTECIPLPIVAFFIGLAFVGAGVVDREEVTMLYWSDACWFIMGSLMFAAAFVKTGVDKRVCMMIFKRLAVPNVRWITLIFFIIISPLAAFISDHALAAMFLPIGMLLYQNSLTDEVPEDPELAKMLMITIAMACNIGGPGAPSGGARNVIMMTYLTDMFGVDIGYFQWMTYCFPFVIIMIPVTWFLINWRFKPRVMSLAPAMEHLKTEIGKMGGWSRQQIWAIIIFVVMVTGWFTEKSLYTSGIIPVRLGIGVIAVGGAVAYIFAGVVNWRDYQEKVDWGVVWLYAGAMIFGRILDRTGAVFWLARSAIEFLAPLGMDSGIPLMLTSNGLTAIITNLMADGPAAAAVGPITLNMAGLVHPGTAFLPFMAMATAIASSFAYVLIIGTPPNAIVYASGYLEPKDYVRVGLPLWIVANIVIVIMTQFYWVVRGFGGMPGF